MISFNSYGEWTKVNEDVDGDSYYIDFETVKEIDGYVVWWEMKDYIKHHKGDMSSVTYTRGDCEASRIKILSILSYDKPMGKGKTDDIAMDLSEFMPWSYVPPGTVALSNLKIVCALAEKSSMNNYQSKVQELIAEFESYVWERDDTSYEVIDDQLSELQQTLRSAYVNNIAARVKTFWRYQGAENDWRCDVYVQQKRNGEVISTEVKNCNTGDSSKARGFKNSIERAVWKSAPFPSAPDDAVFDSEITFTFSVD